MFIKTSVLAALVGSVAVSAYTEVSKLVTREIISRQLSSSSIPSACQSTCANVFTIYNACQAQDAQTCLQVCQQSNFNGFSNCLQCVINNQPGVTSSQLSQVQQVLNTLGSACAAAGQPVSAPPNLTAAGATGSASGSASGASGSASGVVASITSASASASSGGIVVAASSTAAAASSSAGNVISSAASGASAASSAAASATSRAAAHAAAVLPKGIEGALFALAGVVGGAALLI